MVGRSNAAATPANIQPPRNASSRGAQLRRGSRRARPPSPFTSQGAWHAARHDVSDPTRTALGPPSAQNTGVAHVMACCTSPSTIRIPGGKERRPLAAALAA
jgi:hypothetical protein